MPGLLLSLCCFVGCPLAMGAMWLVTRDREGPRLERELQRLNAEAESRRAEVVPATSGTGRTARPDRSAVEVRTPVVPE